MFRSVSVTLTFALLLSRTGPAFAATPLQPTSKWAVNNGETLCIASRSYGSPADPLSLSIVPSPNGETYEILVGSRYRSGEISREEQAAVDFGSGPIKAWSLFYQTLNKSSDVHEFRISSAEMERAKSAPTMTLHVRGSSDFTFEMNSMDDVLNGLDACTEQLKRHWNVGGEKRGQFSRLARADLRAAFSPQDYPVDALTRSQSGTAQFLLLVDQNGKVAGCHPLLATGIPVLDVTGCLVIERNVKFTPALDQSGRPVRSTVVTPPIKWQTH
jgi:hypothetical protein